MINDDSVWLEKLRQKGDEVAQKPGLLQKELSQRPNSPQAGDIFVFAYPETMGLQWVVLRPDDQKSEWLLTVPADGVPMVGSNDVELSKNALCSPLTLRCQQGLWIRAKDFDINLRVGLLEKWERQRALYKEKQISTGHLTSTVSQQQIDDDLDYEEWMEQVIQRREVLIQSLQAIPMEKFTDFKKQLDIIKLIIIAFGLYHKLVNRLPPKQLVPVVLMIGMVFGFGLNPLYHAFYNTNTEISHDNQSNIANVLDDGPLEFDETQPSLSKGQAEQEQPSENRLEEVLHDKVQFDKTQPPLQKCQPIEPNELPEEALVEFNQLPPDEWLNKSLEKIMEGEISEAIKILQQFQATYPNYPE